MMKKRILFVDDERHVLEALQRMLRRMHQEWDMKFVSSGAEALEIMKTEPCDVIVSDMRMPAMNGVELLTQVMHRHPQVVRIVLSGHTDQEAILRSIGPTHQFLSKPCDADTLISTITRASQLRQLLRSESLTRLVSRIDVLPSPPGLYEDILNEMRESEPSIQRVGDLIAQDVAISAKVLQVVNSAFFGIPRRVSSPKQAVTFLGLNTTRGLVLKLSIFCQYKDLVKDVRDFSLHTLNQHSLAVSALARMIAQAQEAAPKTIEDSFLAGLLHDIGQLVLAAALSDQYGDLLESAHRNHQSLWEAEQQALGATHAAVGAYLLGLWGMPDPIVEAVAFHHCPDECPTNTFLPLTAVHVASVLEHESRGCTTESFDTNHLAQLDLMDQLDTWRSLCATAA